MASSSRGIGVARADDDDDDDKEREGDASMVAPCRQTLEGDGGEAHHEGRAA